ncbi:Asl1-like glycosyl hydrolase catalytic domain-containing protein OS=Tsukamurella paurometabola (strain ATCC 8368 / DSM / CCUG 35730 / CIP 100753 / JCM 10117/ KCTC 9821 / NBRC 16120 / NCIMB 702349 / NCTC 13040) OX=521096 GN=Tpau_2598 PE=4 SV=1 [Tsukamurella paurometabola]|uniref:Asl1-like glycosyl hydrolase catalytic domain-containing protein n=1 Tax=Tsukamurella paurometabola (strain ATCC 8368 / DSM 20162 / CCUG 35730 / CIP 100753 / JCM 10117 / KCTC 9821 / NBRC 16120 / NCIMB 702349 / NCTC 13040) TaxID=521096 RepID=D5URZ6_TSUPD|nr:glycosyl hydrolase [Tsukamurella paurometabola]ADG79201.1 conserved hypothetical protein [Tsukamurella paurometabola DSM 20162]SUP34521.1 Beta-xylosidase [Tsukamurella paurometabola]
MNSLIARLIIAIVLVLSTGPAVPAPARASVWVPVGVSSVCTLQPGCDPYDEANKTAAVGGRFLRIPVPWNLIQAHSASVFDWSRVDAAVAGARNAGLMVLLVLYGPAPVWAQAAGADPAGTGNPPADPQTFGAFAFAVAQRYSSTVSAFQVWNEPNIPHYLQPPTAATYLPLLKAAYQGIRAAGAQQPVISGGTSSSQVGTGDVAFLRDLYTLGGRAYFDAVGVHPYTFPKSITSTGSEILIAGRQVMEANGDGAKKMWITEYGQPTGTSSVAVSEQMQASFIVDAIERTQQLSWVAVFVVFNTRDLSVDQSVVDSNFGLFRFDGSPKQAAFSVRTLLMG